MPTYVFWCATCGKQFEKAMTVAQRTRAKPPCPKCKGKKVEPIITSFYAKTTRKS